jgi:hypothetical protein
VYDDLLLLFCGNGGAAIRPARDGDLTADRNFSDVLSTCGSGLAREGGLPADQYLADVLSTCGSELARDDGLSANSNLTGERTPRSGRPVGRLALAFDFDLDLLAPS